MNCHDFEIRLEALAGGELPAAERGGCLRHAEACTACRELLELAQLGAAPAEGDLLAAVMASTSGPACERALERLAEGWGDGVDREVGDPLLALHVEGCSACRATAQVMTALAADLPGLAEVRPDAAFAADVLRATLPLPVRLRRVWERVRRDVVPRLVSRPRFAWEAAFVVTLAFLPLIVASGPTLAAAPVRGAEELARFAQEAPKVELDRLLDEEIEPRVDGTLRELRGSEAVRRTERGFGTFGTTLAAFGDGVAHGAGEIGDAVIGGYGTLRDLAASFLANGEDDDASPDANSTEIEDTAPAPRGPAPEETTR